MTGEDFFSSSSSRAQWLDAQSNTSRFTLYLGFSLDEIAVENAIVVD